MPASPTPHPSHGGPRKSAEPTAALFVRIPTEHARRLDRAAFELRVPKQSLVSELVERYVDPDSPASLAALHGDGARRRITLETLEQGELAVGRHSFRPRTPEVLTADEAAELLQVQTEVVLQLAHAGELPGRELGGEWRFARTALLEWLGTGSATESSEG
jgi:excisionase family DNA binding protein